MAARRPTIDLLAREEFTQHSLGKLLLWILTVGRYIVIFTELIVIAGFITRVILDRNLTSVNEDLFEQKAILSSYRPVEDQLRSLEQQFESYTSLRTSRLDVSKFLTYLMRSTPVDVRFGSLTINQESLDINAVALSPGAFAVFLTQLQGNPEFSDLVLQSVKTGGPQDPSLEFSLTLELATAPPPAGVQRTAEPEISL